jgi:hypothetical protein
MAWELRPGSPGPYYYRATRTPEGRVVKEYYGRGERAQAAAAAVARSQAQRNADHQAVQEERGRLAEPDGLMAELVGLTQLLLEATLLAKGFHRLNYGRWRKRRGTEARSREAARA